MSITNSYASGAISKNTQANKDKYEKEYQESQKVKDAYNALQEHLKNKPGDFSSAYESSMKDIYDRIMNREKFNFDMNSNVMYQQLKDQYAALGKLAMQDTMGQASALTGGYGNSYAQTAGQQTYQNYMQQLNEQLPQLYQMELNRYGMEGDEMYNQYGIAKGMYDSDYAKYRDSMSDFYTDRDYLNGNYQSERDFDYGNYQSNRDYWNSQYWNEKIQQQQALHQVEVRADQAAQDEVQAEIPQEIKKKAQRKVDHSHYRMNLLIKP